MKHSQRTFLQGSDITNPDFLAFICFGVIIGLLIGFALGLNAGAMLSTNATTVKSLWIDGMPTNLTSGNYIAATLADSFDNHISYVSTGGNITISVLNLVQFANYQTEQPYDAVETHSGNSISFWVNYTSGCAGYLYIITTNTSSVRLFPNVTAIYHVPTAPTGWCAT